MSVDIQFFIHSGASIQNRIKAIPLGGYVKIVGMLPPGAGDLAEPAGFDENGEPVRAISADDRVPMVADPLFAGGFNTNLRWRNFDFEVIGAFQAGGILLSSLHSSNSYLNMRNGRRGPIDVD